MEEEIAGLEYQLALPNIASDYIEAGKLAKTIEYNKEKLSELYDVWEQALQTVEQLQQEETME